MKVDYKTKKLKKSLTTDKELLLNYGNRAKRIKQRINQLKSAENLLVIQNITNLRLHQHVAKGKGTWSIDIQENWRILFKIDCDCIPTLPSGGVDMKNIKAIKITSIEDPH
ncbi:MAG: killer suppression protein HigA [Fibrobacter sp.]|nr:killer suppression protein HigA [Fibrobacter sp.]